MRACIEVGVCVNKRMPERVQSKRTSLRTETALEIAARTGRDDVCGPPPPTACMRADRVNSCQLVKMCTDVEKSWRR